MPPDFFNSREDAMFVWATVILGYVLYKDFRGIGSAFLAVLRSFLEPKLPRSARCLKSSDVTIQT